MAHEGHDLRMLTSSSLLEVTVVSFSGVAVGVALGRDRWPRSDVTRRIWVRRLTDKSEFRWYSDSPSRRFRRT